VYTDFAWLAPEVARDSTTKGAWVGRYGRKGHLLLGTCNVANSSALPKGVSVQPHVLKDGCWTANATGSAKQASALVPPPGAGDAPPSLGSLHTDGMTPGALDMLFDSAVFGDAMPCFNVSLYFCDWDGTRSVNNGGGLQVQRRMAVDILALPAREPAWATTVLSEMGALPGGEYVTYEVCDARLAQGVRIRLYLIVGDNAPVSAVFFD
jgi:hypothetical protein